MRKLVFMLRVNDNPNAVTPKNLEISTHRGSRLTIVGNHATMLDVTDDFMSDDDLLTWYRSRYSGFGMGIKILHDVPESAPVNEPEFKEVPVKEETSVNETEKPVEDVIEHKETVLIARVEPKVSVITPDVKEDPVSKMTYQEMLDFAAAHSIEIKSGRGRSEACVRKLLMEWFKTHND